MRCPSCGAISKKRSMKCAECGAFRNRTWVNTGPTASHSEEGIAESAAPTKPKRKQGIKSTPSLIEFPSPTRQAIPEWRKELGERVREVQERRAREGSLESETLPQLLNDEAKGQRPLELLSKPSIPPTNPLVVAALRRIERAHTHSQFSGNTAVATAEAYDEQPEFDLELARAPEEAIAAAAEAPEPIEEPEITNPLEKTHKLSVVSAPVITAAEESIPTIETPSPLEDLRPPVKPKRLIRDNDPALNYLDSVPITLKVESEETRCAPIFFRVFSAVMDLIVVCILAAPVVAMIKLTELHWQNPRVIAFAASTVVVATFLYLTMSIALTGRTLAMRLFSLRVVDARTGLIPTGTQSAGRALFYIISLATAGLGLMYIFVDRERRTAHDRFTRTAVVRV
jgi:uncharacterized RDD family membrane protein YckC